MSSALVWVISGLAILGILVRPRQWPEAIWACLGAGLSVVLGLLPWQAALGAAGKGADVYLFLTGMMLLAELARQEGVFDWLAAMAVLAAKGSRTRLFLLIYIAGTLVTIFLSNDATVVVLTPAVYAAAKKARSEPLPYLLICAFIANAASFVLPISNPANLVVYGKNLPPLVPWLRTFILPALCSILATYGALRWLSREDLAGSMEDGVEHVDLSHAGLRALWGILATGAILISASAIGLDLGLPTCLAAAMSVLIATKGSGARVAAVMKGIAWSVLPLVAGLFVLVKALERNGGLLGVEHRLEACAAMPKLACSLAASFGVAALSNLLNNLPAGLLLGGAVQASKVASHIRAAVLIGVDLGPNLSVTGSLATLLWLMALRREGEQITAWQFFKAGLVVMPPALLLATVVLAVLSR